MNTTDQLGLSLRLSKTNVPGYTTFIQLVRELSEYLEEKELFYALRTGLLENCDLFSRDSWIAILKEVGQCEKKQMPLSAPALSSSGERKKHERVVFFGDDYLPGDIVIEIFHYVDILSQRIIMTGKPSKIRVYFPFSNVFSFSEQAVCNLER